MKIKNVLKLEFEGFSLFEKIFFPLILLSTIIISILINDNKIALISALAGLSYTFLAGKGRVSCYFIGLIGTFCYCYISFKNGFYGNLALYGLYYLPMNVVGMIQWSKNFKKQTREIIKTKLKREELLLYLCLMIISTFILYFILLSNNDKNPIIDSITTIFSIFGQILTVKRCIEQWYIWIIVDILSLIMWIGAYLNNSNCFATIIMWLIYSFLGFYFLYKWKKEI